MQKNYYVWHCPDGRDKGKTEFEEVWNVAVLAKNAALTAWDRIKAENSDRIERPNGSAW